MSKAALSPTTAAAVEVPTGGPNDKPGDSTKLQKIERHGQVVGVRAAKPHRIRTVQDGLTAGEFLLLTEMFKAAEPIPDSKNRYLADSGYRTIAKRTGQDPTTVNRNRKGLAAKLCIEITALPTCRQAAPCLVLHFRNILERWRQAGMAYVRRKNRTIEFVLDVPNGEWPPNLAGGGPDAPTVAEYEAPTVGRSGAPVGKTPTGGVGKMPTGGVGKMPTGGVGEFGVPLSTPNSGKLDQPSTSAASTIVQALRETLGHADDNAALRITRDCRDKVPDATDEEIAHFVREQGGRVARMKGISNPMGVLIKQVPLCFEGESFKQFRDIVRREREAAARERRELAERILADTPDYPEEILQQARQILEE